MAISPTPNRQQMRRNSSSERNVLRQNRRPPTSLNDPRPSPTSIPRPRLIGAAWGLGIALLRSLRAARSTPPPRSSCTGSLLLGGYQPIVVLRVLLIGFSSNSVAGSLCIAGKLQILLCDQRCRSPHPHIRAV